MKRVILRTFKRPGALTQRGIDKTKPFIRETSFGASNSNILVWAKIIDRHSEDMTVDVQLENGLELKHIAVRSNEWVGSGSIGFGERDLPPKDSIVLVAFPYGGGVHEEGIVLCSGFTLFGKHATKWKTELLQSGKETEKLVIDEAGNKTKVDKTTGTTTVELNSGASYKLKVAGSGAKIDLEIASGSSFTITVNGAAVAIDSAGKVSITSATGQGIVLNNGALGANDYVACLFSGAPHCNDALQSVKVP